MAPPTIALSSFLVSIVVLFFFFSLPLSLSLFHGIYKTAVQLSLTARRQTVRPYLVSGGPFVSAMTVVLIDRWPGPSVVSPINHAIERRTVNSLQASSKQQRLRDGDSPLFPTSATERIDRFSFRVRGTSSLEGLHESVSFSRTSYTAKRNSASTN